MLLHDDGSEAATIVRQVRVPRTQLGILVGVALGAAGALTQGTHPQSGVDGHRLILIGVGAAAVLTAITSWLLAVASINNTAQAVVRLTGGSRPPLFASALLVQAADLLGRNVFSWEIPVGLVTAVLGEPYLLWLLVRRK
ncbi:iron chelate uptake ABC transporter family permease subunit [Amycolatopsis sp.]|uniref:iron chelate uptake ABC transporter family permease subunit n=1 Tax=Amycolatopsis sp. TaxID=37632 RepID=UPI002B656651|nr:iron chelate uptake ABC transporter family permease subunit [Amycolatopsis sp.]HVV10968.1 iron chelate uptake ABC transporter family permease subunit [Amycolatopsis sp.]